MPNRKRAPQPIPRWAQMTIRYSPAVLNHLAGTRMAGTVSSLTGQAIPLAPDYPPPPPATVASLVTKALREEIDRMEWEAVTGMDGPGPHRLLVSDEDVKQMEAGGLVLNEGDTVSLREDRVP